MQSSGHQKTQIVGITLIALFVENVAMHEDFRHSDTDFHNTIFKFLPYTLPHTDTVKLLINAPYPAFIRTRALEPRRP